MMIGGDQDVVEHMDPLFASLAPGSGDVPRTPGRENLDGTAEQGYLHCGPSGAGHFAKMVHNGIEYGVMAAYAEGLGILRAANVKFERRFAAIERALAAQGKSPQDATLAELDALWDAAKLAEKAGGS